MSTQNPNSFDKEIEDAQKGANPEDTTNKGTDQKETDKTKDPEKDIDYREKFVQSAKGAQQLLKEKQELEAELAAFKGKVKTPEITDEIVPGFENLDPEQQEGLVRYTNIVTKRAQDEILKNPAIAFAQKNYNESKFNEALDIVIAQFPALLPNKAEFKAQYFNPQNVPDNIQAILESMAKSYLYDKAHDLGAEEAKAAADRLDVEDITGGDRMPTARRTLADWSQMSRTNPAKFASLKKEYEADLESGQLKE